MKMGMLWESTDPKKSATEELHTAIVYYKKKYGTTPTHCFVHPGTDLTGDQPVKIIFARAILPHNYWIGEEK